MRAPSAVGPYGPLHLIEGEHVEKTSSANGAILGAVFQGRSGQLVDHNLTGCQEFFASQPQVNILGT
jgi:hypothetical protein